MQLIDILLEGSVILGCGYIATMFVGFFVRTVRPGVEQVDGLSEVAGEDLLQQAEAIPPVMQPVDIFADDEVIEFQFAEYDDPVDDALPAFPGDVEVVDEPDEVEPIGRPEVRCMAKAMSNSVTITIQPERTGQPPKLTSPELRKRCTAAGVVWRDAHGKNKHLTVAEMRAALNL